MKMLIATILVIMSSSFASAVGGRCIDDGTHPGQNWQTLCSAAAAQMVNYPGREAQICQGYPGCAYIPPYVGGGRCIDDGSHPGQNWQTLCNAAAAQMVNYPGREAQICQGYQGCVYVP